jgi:serine/threonine-protein kinase RIO1
MKPEASARRQDRNDRDVWTADAENLSSQREEMGHVTTQTWTPENLEKLKKFVESGVSPIRAAVHFKRTVVAVKAKAKQQGFPFPDIRDVKRLQRSKEASTRKSLGIVDDPTWRT